VQRLLTAKRDLRLEKELAVLDGFDAIIFEVLVERYPGRYEPGRRWGGVVVAQHAFGRRPCPGLSEQISLLE
jgi:hypothetical protein